jgi:hypothetical protein
VPNIAYTPVLSEGDQTWLASTRGIRNNRTVKLKLSAFTVDPAKGYIPSGTPLAIVPATGGNAGQEAVPYVAAEGTTTGAGVLAGFLFTDQGVTPGTPDTYINAPLVDHGRVRIPRLPVAFVVPTAEAKRGSALFTYETV